MDICLLWVLLVVR